MEEVIKNIIRKIINQKSIDNLTHAEINILTQYAQVPKQKDNKQEKKPFWCWIRKNLLTLIQIDIYDRWDISEVITSFGQILSDKEFGSFLNEKKVLEIFGKEYSRSEIKNILLKKLNNDSELNLAESVLLSGICELTELEKNILKVVNKLSYDSYNYYETIGNTIFSLELLNSSELPKFVSKFKFSKNYRIQSALNYVYQDKPNLITEDEIVKLLDEFDEEEYFWIATDLIMRVAPKYHALQTILNKMLNSSPDVGNKEKLVAKIIISSKKPDLVEKYLTNGQSDLDIDNMKFKNELLYEILWQDAKWCLPIINKLINKKKIVYSIPLILGVKTYLDKENISWLDNYLHGSNKEQKLVAILSFLFIEKGVIPFSEQSPDDNKFFKAVATMISSLKGTIADYELEIIADLFIEDMMLENYKELLYFYLKKNNLTIPKILIFDRIKAEEISYLDSINFFNQYPYFLVEYLSETNDEMDRQKFAFIIISGLLENNFLKYVLESYLNSSVDEELSFLFYLQTRCHYGPLSDFGIVQEKINILEENESAKLDVKDLLPVLYLAFWGKSQFAEKAILSLSQFNNIPNMEYLLNAMLYNSSFPAHLKSAALKAITNMTELSYPINIEISKILKNETQIIDDPKYLLSLLAINDEEINKRLLKVIANSTLDEKKKLEYVILLFKKLKENDDDLKETLFTLQKLLKSGKEFNRFLINLTYYSVFYLSLSDIVFLMSEIGSTEFLKRLLELFEEPDEFDFYKKDIAQAIMKITEKNPKYNLIVINLQDPISIKNEFDLIEEPSSYIPYSFDEFNSETAQYLLKGYDNKKDVEFSKKFVGRKVIIEPITKDTNLKIIKKSLNKSEWHKIAMYLEVVYADEETKNIIAEIGTEPSGEIINALLQNKNFQIFRVYWT